MQRWEFFIGDPPQPKEEGSAAQAPRPPIAQLRLAEHYAVSGGSSWTPAPVPYLNPVQAWSADEPPYPLCMIAAPLLYCSWLPP